MSSPTLRLSTSATISITHIEHPPRSTAPTAPQISIPSARPTPPSTAPTRQQELAMSTTTSTKSRVMTHVEACQSYINTLEDAVANLIIAGITKVPGGQRAVDWTSSQVKKSTGRDAKPEDILSTCIAGSVCLAYALGGCSAARNISLFTQMLFGATYILACASITFGTKFEALTGLNQTDPRMIFYVVASGVVATARMLMRDVCRGKHLEILSAFFIVCLGLYGREGSTSLRQGKDASLERPQAGNDSESAVNTTKNLENESESLPAHDAIQLTVALEEVARLEKSNGDLTTQLKNLEDERSSLHHAHFKALAKHQNELDAQNERHHKILVKISSRNEDLATQLKMSQENAFGLQDTANKRHQSLCHAVQERTVLERRLARDSQVNGVLRTRLRDLERSHQLVQVQRLDLQNRLDLSRHESFNNTQLLCNARQKQADDNKRHRQIEEDQAHTIAALKEQLEGCVERNDFLTMKRQISEEKLEDLAKNIESLEAKLQAAKDMSPEESKSKQVVTVDDLLADFMETTAGNEAGFTESTEAQVSSTEQGDAALVSVESEQSEFKEIDDFFDSLQETTRGDKATPTGSHEAKGSSAEQDDAALVLVELEEDVAWEESEEDEDWGESDDDYMDDLASEDEYEERRFD